MHTHIKKKLAKLKKHNHYRNLRVPHGRDFSSNDYFCLAHHESIKESVKRAVDAYGYGATSSRFIRGDRDIYSPLEKKLAQFKKTEAALLFSSGYDANLGVLSSLISPNDVVFSDAHNHASINDGLKLSGARVYTFKHRDINALYNLLTSVQYKRAFIVTESLFSMDGTIAPLDQYAKYTRDYNAHLIVDEAHAVGVYGDKGAGLIDYFDITNDVMCAVNGLGKAFACFGAFVSGPEYIIDYITQRARTLMYKTALPPLSLFAINTALEIISTNNDLREQLFARIHIIKQGLRKMGIDVNADLSPIFPIIVGNEENALKLEKVLQDRGFDIRAIRPPTVKRNTCRLRMSVNLSQSYEDIYELLALLGEIL